MKPGDTIWGYWKDHGQGQGWPEFRQAFERQNAAILKDGWLHPGEVALVPTAPGGPQGTPAPAQPEGAAEAQDSAGGCAPPAAERTGPGRPAGPVARTPAPEAPGAPPAADERSGSGEDAPAAGGSGGPNDDAAKSGQDPLAPDWDVPPPDAPEGAPADIDERGIAPGTPPAAGGGGSSDGAWGGDGGGGDLGGAPDLKTGGPDSDVWNGQEPDFVDGGFRSGSAAGAGDNDGAAVNGGDTGATPGAPRQAQPPYSRSEDSFVDWADWGKQFAFANRAVPRIWLDGLVAANPNDLHLKGWNNASKVFGLGGFALFQTASKAKSAAGYYADGDPWRGTAEVSDLVNGLRIGFNGFKPLMELSPRIAKAPWFETVAKYAGGENGALFRKGQANKLLGLGYGNAFGVGTNVLAGGLRGVAIYTDYREAMDKALTPLDRDRATHALWQGEIGTLLDTANDAAPFVIDGGASWSTWLVGKVADHAAASMLEGSGYKPMSFGNDHARNLMGLASGIGLAPDVPWKDPALARSADEHIVISTSNRIHRAAGVGAGATDIAVTATEGIAVGYLTGGSPTAIYGAWNVDHAIRQGVNIWTDHFWQRPGEREAAVVAAGLDPRLDTRAVEYAQEDFLHRLWAGAAHDFTAAFKQGKDIAGGANASDRRWLELDTMYSSPAISDATSGRGNPHGWFSPGTMWKAVKLTNPGLMNIDQAPQQAGIVAGWVAGGGIPRTVDKVKDAINDGYGKVTNTVSAVKDDVVRRTKDAGAAVGDAAWQVKTTVTATFDSVWTAGARAAGTAKDTVTDWGSSARKKADGLVDAVAFWR